MDKYARSFRKLGLYIEEYSHKNRNNENIPVYSVTNSEGFCKEFFNKEVASQDKSTYKIVPWGYFAYNPSRINVGSISWQSSEERVVVSPLYNIFKVSDEINKDYLLYYLKSPSTIDYIDTISRGTVRSNLKLSRLKEFLIPYYSIDVQDQIVSELDSIKDSIAFLQQQVKDLDSLAQSIFYDIFGDPMHNEKGWPVKPLSEIVKPSCPITYGIVQPGENIENGIPVVRPVDMTETFILREGLKQTTKEISNSYKRTILKGTEILMCVRGRTGLLSIATPQLEGCNVTRGITPIDCNEHNDIWFIYYQLKTESIQRYIADYTKGIALKQINMEDVRRIPLITPDLSLQRIFGSRISSIEASKDSLKVQISEMKILLASRMQFWFY